MKNLLLLLILLFVSTFTHAIPFRPNTTEFELGQGASEIIKISADIGLGASNPYIQLDNISGKWQFFNVGDSEASDLGSGSGSGGGDGVNLLINEGLEEGVADWTSSVITISEQVYTNGTDANAKYGQTSVSTATGEYVERTFTWPDMISGGCMAHLDYQNGDGVVIKIFDDAVEVASHELEDSTEWIKSPTLVFPCPVGGSVALFRIETSGSGQTINIDNVYMGSNKGFIPFQGVGSEFLHSGSTGAINVANFWNTTANNEDEFDESLINNLSTSNLVEVVNVSGQDRLQAKKNIEIAITVGVGNAGTNGRITIIDSTSSPLASPPRTGDDSAANSSHWKGHLSAGDFVWFQIDSGLDTRAGGISIVAREINPVVQKAYTPPQADFNIEAIISGADPSIQSFSTFQEVSNSSLSLVNVRGSSSIACNSTNPATGTTCSAGNETIGINFNAPMAGDYKVCFDLTVDTRSDETIFKLVHTQNSSQTIISEGLYLPYIKNGNALSGHQIEACNTFSFSSSGEKTVRLFVKHPDASLSVIWANTDSSNIRVTVDMVRHNVSRPIIQNMVSTSYLDGINETACKIDLLSGTPTGDSSSGLCSSWINTIDDLGNGNVRLNFVSGTFSAEPVCSLTWDSGGQGFYALNGNGTASMVEVRVMNAAQILSDNNFNIRCTGAKQ